MAGTNVYRGGQRLEKNESTEILFENRNNFPSISDDDGESDTEPSRISLLTTPSMSLAGFAKVLESPLQLKSSENSKPLETSRAVTTLLPRSNKIETSLPAHAPPVQKKNSIKLCPNPAHRVIISPSTRKS